VNHADTSAAPDDTRKDNTPDDCFMSGNAESNATGHDIASALMRHATKTHATYADVKAAMALALPILARLTIAEWERLIDAYLINPDLEIYVNLYAVIVRHGSTKTLMEFLDGRACYDDLVSTRPRLHLLA